MSAAIASFCSQNGQIPPESHSQYVRCIFSSLARRYGQVLDILREMAPFPIEKLHVIGGGSKNALLNRMTADVIGIPVVAGPSEATAIGNCMVQAKRRHRYGQERNAPSDSPMRTHGNIHAWKN